MLLSANLWLVIISISSCQGRCRYYDTDVVLNDWKNKVDLEDSDEIYDNSDHDNIEVKKLHDSSGIREEDLFEGDLIVDQDLINAYYGLNIVSVN